MNVEKLIELLIRIEEKSDQKKEEIAHYGEETRIVILQRGWVIVGKYFQIGHDCWIEDGYVIRVWGTTKGLGELALNGKTEKTILDPIPLTKFHEMTVVASMICKKSHW